MVCRLTYRLKIIIKCKYKSLKTLTLNTIFIFRDEDAPMMIEDESAVKPSGWLDDEAELIPDPVAVRPEDW